MKFKAFLGLTILLLWLPLAFVPARAQVQDIRSPAHFDNFMERFVAREYVKLRRNKAYAIGPNGEWSYGEGYASLEEAKTTALKFCQDSVRKKYNIADPECEVVLENDTRVGSISDVPPLGSNYLPQPDLPLTKGRSQGTLEGAKGLVLILHGCDGMGDPANSWYASWRNYFFSKKLVIFEPNSFADPESKQVCGYNLDVLEDDRQTRLRVAQTVRSIAILKKYYPNLPIYIWGHSAGGHIAQLHDYGVKGTIVTGAYCYNESISLRSPALFVFGTIDGYADPRMPTTANFTLKQPITKQIVLNKCRQLSTKKNQRFVMVRGGDHFVSAQTPSVRKELDRIFGK